MSKVTTFAQRFMKGHPREGQQTYFVEKFLNQGENNRTYNWRHPKYFNLLIRLNEKKIKEGKLTREIVKDFYNSLNKDVCDKKGHTIRAGHRWNIGDEFSPRVWSGKPYRSPQIIFAPDVEVKKSWEFDIHDRLTRINRESHFPYFNGSVIKRLANNDGLSIDDFLAWF